MANFDYSKKYADLTAAIDEIEQKKLDILLDDFADFLISSQGGGKANSDGKLFFDDFEERRDELSAKLLRAALGIYFVESGMDQYMEQLLDDIKDSVCGAKSVLTDYAKDKEYQNCIYDILSLLCKNYGIEGNIEKYIKYVYPKFKAADKEFSENLADLIANVAGFCLENNWISTYNNLLKNTYYLLLDRDSKYRYICFTFSVLSSLGVYCPEETSKIFKDPKTSKMFQKTEKAFKNCQDQYAFEFYRLYGICCEQKNDAAEAYRLFEKGYDLALSNFGENSWQAAIMKAEECRCRLVINKRLTSDELAAFVDLAEKILSGGYDDISERERVYALSNTLYSLISIWFTNNAQGINTEKYLSTLEKIFEKYGEDCGIQQDDIKSFRARYDLTKGKLIAAEAALTKISQNSEVQTGSSKKDMFKRRKNLLASYVLQNDYELAVPLFEELEQELISDNSSVFSLFDKYQLYTIAVAMDASSLEPLDSDRVSLYFDLIFSAIEDMGEEESDPTTFGQIAMFISTAVSKLYEDGALTGNQQEEALEILKDIESHDTFRYVSNAAKINLYFSIFRLGNLKDSHYLNLLIKNVGEPYLSPEDKMNTYQVAALHYCIFGNTEKASEYSKKCYSEITELIVGAVKYMNDHRLVDVLSTVYPPILACYGTARSQNSLSAQYKLVLNYKSAASLAIKERNRYLHSGLIDDKLISKIKSLQDKIAEIDNSTLIFGTEPEYGDFKEELRRYELEYAEKTKAISRIKRYSALEIQTALPKKSVLIEYCLWRQIHEDKLYPRYDVYICNSFEIHRLTIECAEDINNSTERYVQLLQKESANEISSDELDEKETLRKWLYQQLVFPICEYIKGTDTVYFSPDGYLTNLPFELLYDTDISERLEYSHTIIKLECGRDLLNADDALPAGGSLVIGDPSYSTDNENNKEDGSEPDRSGISISRLEFSGAEARMVAKILKSDCFTGLGAKASLLTNAHGSENLHIATHGVYDDNGYSIPELSAYLLFAGAQDYFYSEEESEEFGRGIVTADEISRLDLRGTKLAVISACFSGVNDLSANKGFTGIIGALSSAGVKYVITHLWRADDLASAILMTEFYKVYADSNTDPPTALRMAKAALRRMTMRELRDNGWVDIIENSGVKDRYSEFINYNDRAKPFMSESFWGGFACYKCN